LTVNKNNIWYNINMEIQDIVEIFSTVAVVVCGALISAWKMYVKPDLQNIRCSGYRNELMSMMKNNASVEDIQEIANRYYTCGGNGYVAALLESYKKRKANENTK